MPRRKRRRRGFGQGTIRKRGLSWSIAWRENGRRRFATAPDETTAKRMLAKILSDAALGTVGLKPDTKNAPTLGELAKPWLKRREKTHRAWRDDACRWRVHLGPAFDTLKPHEVDAAAIRRFVEGKLAGGLAASTVGHCVRLLSTFFCDVVEQGHATSNPIASLPRSTRRLYRSTHDPRTTPFLERLEDVRRVFLALPDPVNVSFAVGAFAGLRTGEVLGLAWQDIDLEGRRIHVRQQIQDGKVGPLKDSESRVVPLQAALAPILAAYRLATGGEGFLFKPAHGNGGGRPDLGSAPQFMRPQTLHGHLAKALAACGLPSLTWYESTRHTFASQFVLGGGSLEVLRQVMGHSSVTTTERYSHLKPDLFRESAFEVMKVDLSQPAGAVVSLPSSRQRLVSEESAETPQLSLTL
ncbi:MAG: site-specific integrase [Deltaproteobacteria bacterium]|nr:site-specific integrase [Deltaproteobacteria bacterium]